VIGHVAAAFHLDHRQPAALQLSWRERETRRSGRATQRHDRFVLHEQQDVLRRLPGDPRATEFPLEIQHL
jgi:hypothetical protein